jgi:hypothetical protein
MTAPTAAKTADTPAMRILKFAARLKAPLTDKLAVLGLAIDILRETAQDSIAGPIAAANFLAGAANAAPWGYINFEVTAAVRQSGRGWEVAKQYGVAEADIPGVLLAALANFAEMLADGSVTGADIPAADIFDALVAEAAENSKHVAVAAAQPELFMPKLVNRIFTAAPFSPEVATQLAAGVRFGLYRGVQGNDMRCLTFQDPSNVQPDQLLALLETGEVLAVDPARCRFFTTAEEYAAIPAALLAYATLLARDLELANVLPPISAADVRAGLLGKFTHFVHPVVVAETDAQALVRVLDTTAEPSSMQGATGPVGVSLRVPVPDLLDTVVTLDAQHSAGGPYLTARLVSTTGGTDRVLMRLDQPRHDSATGVFLFPHSTHAVAVFIQGW